MAKEEFLSDDDRALYSQHIGMVVDMGRDLRPTGLIIIEGTITLLIIFSSPECKKPNCIIILNDKMLKRFWKPFVLIFITGLLSVTWYTRYAEMERLESLPVGTEVGERAPEFTGTTVDGETVSLSDYRGKIVLVNDFATWCGPCLFETPHLVDLYHEQMDDIAILGLNILEQDEDVAAYQAQFNIPYPLLLDPDGKLTEIYSPIGLPTTWFIDEHGIIQYVHSGPMTMAMIRNILDDLRNGREPDIFAAAGTG